MNIQFIKPHAPYQKDSLAVFPDAVAMKYIQAGVAVEVKKPVTPAERTPIRNKMVKK